MKQAEFNEKFWGVVTYEAARDEELVRAARWLLHMPPDGEEPAMDGGEPDYAEVLARIRDRYGLDPEAVDLAFGLCEEAVARERGWPTAEGAG